MRAARADAQSRLWACLVFGLIALVWSTQVRGTISSNDGSHLALARSLALRQETSLGPDTWRTLGVDLAAREGRPYSDRPPGAAFLAIPAAWAGARLDDALGAAAAPWPRSSKLYAVTAAVRFAPPVPPNGAGTALAIALHGIAVGLLGLFALWQTLSRSRVGLRVRAGVVLTLALASAYGAYAPLLFAHVTAAAATWLALWAALEARDDAARAPSWAALAGLAGALAIAADYSLVVMVVPTVALTLPLRRWGWAFASAAVVGAAVARYHDAAFGSPLAIGYDFSTNFAFARGRGTTFSGDMLEGLNTLLGVGHGAGWLVRTPVALLGLVSVALPRATEAEGPDWPRRWLLASLPWLLLIAAHRTPWGGAGQDYRYIIPLLGPVALLLATRLRPGAPTFIALALALLSAGTFWRGFCVNYELAWISSPWLALPAAFVVALGCAISRRRRREDGPRTSAAGDAGRR